MHVENNTSSSCFDESLSQQDNGNPSHPYVDLLNEFVQRNEDGIRIVTSTIDNGDGGDSQIRSSTTSQLQQGVACFRQALAIARSYCAHTTSDIKANEMYSSSTSESSTSSCTTSNIALAKDEVIHTSKKDDSSEFIFKRPFKISRTIYDTSFNPSPPASVLPCAVVVYNLALVHHMMSINDDIPKAHRNHFVRQGISLYQNCWDLIATVLNMMNQESSRDHNANTSTGWAAIADDPMLELLAMAVLNNMTIACREMAEYETSRCLSSRLRLLLSTSIHFQHQLASAQSSYPTFDPLQVTSTQSTDHPMDDDDNENREEQVKVAIDLDSKAILEEKRWNFMLTAMVFSMSTTVAPEA